MAKWADYLISRVSKNETGVITQVFLHVDNGDTMGAGVVKSCSEVIGLLKQGITVKTITWGYPNWFQGATVGYVKGTKGEFLRTDRDSTDKDNLDNLILL